LTTDMAWGLANIPSPSQLTTMAPPEVGIGPTNPQRMLFCLANYEYVSGIGGRPGLVSVPAEQGVVVPAEKLGRWTLPLHAGSGNGSGSKFPMAVG
jgi:hypothetical protein